jgi:hypothetical protein
VFSNDLFVILAHLFNEGLAARYIATKHRVNTMKKFLRYFVFTLSFIFSTQQLATAQCNSPHFTQMLANNGQNGIMFDITAITDVTIDSVWSNWDPGTLPSVEIWFKTGTCVGSQATPGAWTLIGSVNNLLSAGNNNFTQIPIYINQFVAAGQTVALYVTKGTTTGAVNANYTTGPVGAQQANSIIKMQIFKCLTLTENLILLPLRSIQGYLMGEYFTHVALHHHLFKVQSMVQRAFVLVIR